MGSGGDPDQELRLGLLAGTSIENNYCDTLSMPRECGAVHSKTWLRGRYGWCFAVGYSSPQQHSGARFDHIYGSVGPATVWAL